MQTQTIVFDEQDVMPLKEIGDIIFVMVYPEASNPIENIRSSCGMVPHFFLIIHQSIPTLQWDKKQRTSEEMV